ncbi:cation-translocating P-type ATPase [Chitinimonas sp. JJ19]|uniref:cation-translocating P-type ATPase n=1 Tax=Chitinimonas sp. JJ19 TaxID=3109352 RepID=UPI003002EC29
MHPWHAMEPPHVAAHFEVDAQQGLDEAEAATRLQQHGRNRPSAPPTRSGLARFLSQLLQPLILVLIGAGVITALLGETVDASVILGVVLINALVGYIQEGKAEAALAALARSMTMEATVLRGGNRQRLDAAHLVPGDVVVLAAGDKVPADLRLCTGKSLRTSEAALTGESTPVDKHAQALPAETVLGDRRNMAYASTLVVAGQGSGVVTATGDHTEAGKVSGLIAGAAELSTPLTRKLTVFTRYLLVAILALAALTFAVGIWRGESAFNMFMAAVALAVGAIPEGLPAAVTITLAIGVARMSRRRAIIRKLPAVETLGSTTVICSDKTGTLTENAMTVQAIWSGGTSYTVSGLGYDPVGQIATATQPAEITPPLRETLLAGVLCNDAKLLPTARQWTLLGDPTEGALLVAASKAGLDCNTLYSVFPRLDELPFDPNRQYMVTLHEIEGERLLYAKGAVEKLLPACGTMLNANGQPIPLAPEVIHRATAQMAEAGLRVLALTRSTLAAKRVLDHDCLGADLVFLGLMGMIDPPRPQVRASIAACHNAGIKVKMITGDHPGTARAIACQLGITANDSRAWTGQELAQLDDAALCRVARDIDVFARVEPEQKFRLVRALQANGEVVAMTGDGVNDAPALKQADIGVAMGLGGTAVAREAAAMVLTDDNFSTIEAAIEEGRGIYDNLLKFIVWTIPTNAGEGLVILAAILAGVTLPITPLQILWINMTTAVLLGMMLAFEPPRRDMMQQPPRSPTAPLLSPTLLRRIVLVSLLMLIGAFSLFELALRQGSTLAEARTVAANVFVLMEILYLFNCRTLSQPCWANGWFSNHWVWLGSAAMLLLQLAFTYAPAFNTAFQTAPISAQWWLTITAFATASSVLIELEKALTHPRGKEG